MHFTFISLNMYNKHVLQLSRFAVTFTVYKGTENTSQGALKPCSDRGIVHHKQNTSPRGIYIKTIGCQSVDNPETQIGPSSDFMYDGEEMVSFFSVQKKSITVENLMDVSRMRASGLILSTSLHKTVYETVYTQRSFLSVSRC